MGQLVLILHVSCVGRVWIFIGDVGVVFLFGYCGIFHGDFGRQSGWGYRDLAKSNRGQQNMKQRYHSATDGHEI